MFEYYFDMKKGFWVFWVDVIFKYVYDFEKKFLEILVFIVDIVRIIWLFELMVNIKRFVVFVGEIGIFKLVIIVNFLRGFDKDVMVCCI